MKKHILLVVAGCLALPAFTHANEPTRRKAQTITPELARSFSRKKVVYYITDTPRTGSMIPMVYRQYDGRIDSASNAAVYGGSAIQNSASTDLGATLSRFDPSITLTRGR